jgi:arylsulfatase A-like enzyme
MASARIVLGDRRCDPEVLRRRWRPQALPRNPLECQLVARRKKQRGAKAVPAPTPAPVGEAASEAVGPMRWPRAVPVAAAAVVALLLAGAGLWRGSGRAHPNLLLITLDTVRADHLGVYGAPQAKTPRLDGLAARGVRFDHAETAVPLTGPSHATILTGQYPPVHGVRDNVVFALGDERRTLAEMLRAKGYRTGAFVGAYTVAGAFGFRQGFDVFHENFKEGSGAGAQRRGNEVADDSIAWLDAPSSGPFFAWLHFYDPHAPYDPPEPYKSAFADRAYDGEIAFTDEQVGRVLDALL